MRHRFMHLLFLLFGATLALAMGSAQQVIDPDFTSDFGIERCQNLVPNGDNLFFPLWAGTFLRYEGEDDGEFVELEITVLNQVRPIVFRVNGKQKTALARVIEEREWADGELVEVSRNFFAACPKTGNVFYFGEEVDDYEDGRIVGHGGAWLAGRNGAMPGLIMPGTFIVGSRYFQEVAPGVALDRARNARTGLTVNTPAGTFEDCVKVIETSPLDDPGDQSIKIYAPGVGLIVDDDLRLVEFRSGQTALIGIGLGGKAVTDPVCPSPLNGTNVIGK